MEETLFHQDEEVSYKEAYNYSIRLLTKRDYSEHKMRLKLISRKYSENIINEVVSKLIESKYLREEAYAQARVKSLMLKGYSHTYILQQLESEKVQITEEMIQEVFTDYKLSSEIQITHLLEKKLRGVQPKALVDFNFKKKLIRYLLSKGHSLEESSRFVEMHMRSDDDRSEYV